MTTITLPHGEVHYRTAGPADDPVPRPSSSSMASSSAPRCGRLWPTPWPPRAFARSPPISRSAPTASRSATAPISLPAASPGRSSACSRPSTCDDVTLVGNDTGGAICQFLVDTDATRVGRLVLTNCDAFEQFPPASLRKFTELLTRRSAVAAAAQAMRATRFRHSAFGYGPFARQFDAAMTAAWVEPLRTDERVHDDVVRFAQAIDAADLVAVGARLGRFTRPVRSRLGHRRIRTSHSSWRRASSPPSPTPRLVEVDGARTFVPLDEPERVAAEIVALSRRAGTPAR